MHYSDVIITLRWRHNDLDGVSNHQPHGCLLNRLFRRRSKKTSKLRVTGLCVGNSPGPVNSPHKGPVTRKMFPFDDVIMSSMASQITGVSSVYSAVCSGADQRTHQSSASLVFVRGNSQVTGEFPAQWSSNAENVSIKISLKFAPN